MVYILFFVLTLAASTAIPPLLQRYETVRKGNIDEQGPYLEGDMLLSEEQLMQDKSGMINDKYRWPNKLVPYITDSNFTRTELEEIQAAISEIESKTCIRFAPRTRDDKDYINITRGGPNTGCWSYVGRQGGVQPVNLQAGNPGCIHTGIIAHELIHTIGFFHEQSRPDRDNFVTIQFQNIQPGTESNFDKYSYDEVSTFKTTYDYGSVMHYSAYAFTKNGNATILPTKKDVPVKTLGQRNGLSSTDAQKINNMYRC